MSQFVGIDGCKAGWFAVMLKNTEEYDFEIFPNIEELWNSLSSAQDFPLDIPIGLKEKDEQGRRCDTEARELLGAPRASSVFTPPSRCVLHMHSREEASEENRRLTGRRISTQTWAIVPKIKEVDEFLRETLCARGKLREIHPEVLFCVLNKGDSMLHRKGLPEGFQERLCVLRNHFCRTDDLVNTALGMIQGRGAERDDILDALAAAVTARLGENDLTSIPASPEKDGCGLRMEMRVPKSHHKSKDK